MNSEVIKKTAITFSIAITITFVKLSPDGEVISKVSPCFTSKSQYINSVSTYDVKDILFASNRDIKTRFDDFVEQGSGWTIDGFNYYDLQITQINDYRGACSNLLIDTLKILTSKKSGLLNITNADNKCLLYCIAASYTCTSKWTQAEKSNPQGYIEFVKLIKTSDFKNQLQFPIKLTCISDLEHMNRQKKDSICFRINVFREDPLTNKVCLIRKSSYNDGKIVNVLLVEFEHHGKDFLHYVLIESTSFFKKRYINRENGKMSTANTLFCTNCFEHFRSKNMLEQHMNICGKQSHLRVFPKGDETIHFKSHEYGFKRIFTGYADFESILENTSKKVQCP